MAKQIIQIRYYGPNDKRNSNFDIFSNLTTQIKGNITHLGIQAPSDTKFYLNGEDFLVPSTGLYELQGEFRVTSLRFDREYISKEKAKTIIIDLIYEGNEVDNTGTAEAAANSAWTAATLAQQILDNITKYPGGGTDAKPEVFIAEYGVTKYEEIVAAYDAGKAIFCRATLEDDTGTEHHMTLPLVSLEKAEMIARFTGALSFRDDLTVLATVYTFPTNHYSGISWDSLYTFLSEKEHTHTVGDIDGLEEEISSIEGNINTLTQNANTIPKPTDSDEGKFLQVVNGEIAYVKIPNAEEVAY